MLRLDGVPREKVMKSHPILFRHGVARANETDEGPGISDTDKADVVGEYMDKKGVFYMLYVYRVIPTFPLRRFLTGAFFAVI